MQMPECLPTPPELLVRNYNDYKTEKVFSAYLPSEGFSSRYDPQNQFIAIGCNNGMKLLHSLNDNKVIAKVQCPREDPVTCVKWRPMGCSKNKVLGVANSGGLFEYYHVPSMKRLFSIEEKENSLHCCDFSKTGQHFATAGKDCHIRIYDENTKSVSTDLGCAEWNYRGHSNRIFSIKFIDDNTIISGGWDSVLHLWDVRQGKSVKSIFGPHVAGDSLDYQNGQILVGCYASKSQIQILDYNMFMQKECITWTSAQDKDRVAYVYAAGFSNYQTGTIIAGACGINQVKVFHLEDGKYVASTLVHDLRHGCFSIDSCYKSQEFVFTTAHQHLFIYKEDK